MHRRLNRNLSGFRPVRIYSVSVYCVVASGWRDDGQSSENCANTGNGRYAPLWWMPSFRFDPSVSFPLRWSQWPTPRCTRGVVLCSGGAVRPLGGVGDRASTDVSLAGCRAAQPTTSAFSMLGLIHIAFAPRSTYEGLRRCLGFKFLLCAVASSSCTNPVTTFRVSRGRKAARVTSGVFRPPKGAYVLVIL